MKEYNKKLPSDFLKINLPSCDGNIWVEYYDGPLIWAFKDERDDLFLVYWADEDSTYSRYMVIPTTEKLVNDLKECKISIREFAFKSSDFLYLWDNGLDSRFYQVVWDEIPFDYLPLEGVYLHPPESREF